MALGAATRRPRAPAPPPARAIDERGVLDGHQRRPRLSRARARCGRCGSAWQSRMPTTPGPQVVTSSSPSAGGDHHRRVGRGERRDGGVRRREPVDAHQARAFHLPRDDAVPARSPVAARGAEQVRRQLRALEHHGRADLALGEHLHDVRVDAERAAQRAGAPVEQIESIAQWSSAARRARSATARAQRALLPPRVACPPARRRRARTPPARPREVAAAAAGGAATASAAAARKSSAARCSAAVISPRGGSDSAPSALMPRLSRTNA